MSESSDDCNLINVINFYNTGAYLITKDKRIRTVPIYLPPMKKVRLTSALNTEFSMVYPDRYRLSEEVLFSDFYS